MREDLHLGRLLDPEVYQVVVKQQLILLTYNIKHFRQLGGIRNDAGIIGIPPHYTSAQVDTKLTALLTKSTPNTLQGKYIPLSGGQNHLPHFVFCLLYDPYSECKGYLYYFCYRDFNSTLNSYMNNLS